MTERPLCVDFYNWAGKASHTVLDTHLGSGTGFLHTWAMWLDDPKRCARLHYVAVSDSQLLQNLPAHPLSDTLAVQLWGLYPGIHRISLNQGNVLLTLAIPKLGEGLQAVLRALVCNADSVRAWFETGPNPYPDTDMLKALARHCVRGTRMALGGCSPALRQTLQNLGFDVNANGQQAIYNPRWALHRQPLAVVQPSQALVIGAGLSGAAVAHSLACRGWQVQVIDAAPQPAQGASSLPVGLLVPHVSPDDAPLSRASRAGLRMTHQAAQALLEVGTDWHPTPALRDGVLLPHAAWIKPQALVRAWLNHSGIRFEGGRSVARFHGVRDGDRLLWQALDAHSQVLAQAPLVVVCAAYAVAQLLPARGDEFTVLHQYLDEHLDQVAGQVAYGPWTAELAQCAPPHPISGHGHFIPNVPGVTGSADAFWLSGSTYERMPSNQLDAPAGLQANRSRLNALLPQSASAINQQFVSGLVQTWQAQRCTSRDRFPLAGQWLPGLYTSTAMGSRGLTFAALSAELLAARLHGEPLPMEARLARAFDVGRWSG